MPVVLWSYLLIVLLAQPKAGRVLTAMDIYAALGQDVSSQAVESLLDVLGGAVAGGVQTLDSPADPDEHHVQHAIKTAQGAELKVLDGKVQAVRFDLKEYKGRLPFGLRRGMQAAELANLFPDVMDGAKNPVSTAGGFMQFTVEERAGLVQFTCLMPTGYCHTRATHLAGLSLDSLASRPHMRKKDYLAWVRAREDRLRQSLNSHAVLLDTALAPEQHQRWAYELGAKAGAYEPGKGVVIDFRTVGERRRVIFDPNELQDFLFHFLDAQVVLSCTPDRDDCALHIDRLEVLNVSGRGYLLLPEFGVGELPPYLHRAKGAWHGE